jgi:hypothetical protein
MKKLVLSLMFVAIGSTVLFAQSNYDEQKFHFGLKASPVVSWLRFEDDLAENDGIRIGFTYGLMTEFAFTQNYAFLTGVDVSYRGGKYTSKRSITTFVPFDNQGNIIYIPQIIETDIEVTQKFQIIEIPIGLKLKTNEIGYIKYYGIFGAQPGFIVKAEEDLESSNQDVKLDHSKRGNQSDFSFFNISLNVGLGLEYNLGGSTAFTTGIHYTNGLIDIWKVEDAQMRMDAITLNIGVLF